MLKKLFDGTFGRVFGYWTGSSSFSDGGTTSPDRSKGMAPEPKGIMQTLPSQSRWEEVRYCRYLDKNLSIVSGTLDDIETYTIGAGFIIEFHGGDEAWQKEQEADFSEWSKNPTAEGRNSLATEARINLRGVLRDGECFPCYTFREDGEPCIQTLETHVFRNLNGVQVAPGYIDGILYNSAGQAIDYKTFNGEHVPASSILHLCEPRRAGELRCSPRWAGNINPLFDSKELQLLAGTGYKYQLITPVVVSELPSSRGNPVTGKGDSTLSAADSEGQAQRFEKATGSVIYRTQQGGGITMQRPEFPGQLYTVFQECYAKAFCADLNWPFDFTSLTNKGGTTQRAVIEKASRRAEVIQKTILDKFLYRAAIHRLAWRITNGLTTAPDNWWKISFRYTRSASVDMGRETAADAKELSLGMQGIPEFFARFQQDWRVEFQKNADALGLSFAEYSRLVAFQLYGAEAIAFAKGQSQQTPPVIAKDLQKPA